MFFVSGNAAKVLPAPRSPTPRPAPAPRPSPPTNSQRGANEPVDIAPMALLQAQQVMLAQMDVAQLVIIPVTAPIHILRRETLQKEALRRGCGLVKRLCGAVVGPESLWSKARGKGTMH